LLAWEEEALEECRTLLLDVSLHANVSNRWVWLPDPRGGYSVCGAYQLLTIKDTPLADSATSMIWHNQVSLKVSVFVWRLLRDKLPTKSNLVMRGVISSEASQCISDCGSIETAQHLFLACYDFSSLWPMVRHWLGFMGVDTMFCPIIFFSLCIQQVVAKQRGHSFSSFGSFVYESYGTNVITECLIML